MLSLSEVYRRFRNAYSVQTSVYFCETTKRNIPDDCCQQIRRLEPEISLPVTLFVAYIVRHRNANNKLS
jgi:hypothetical protein